MSPPAGDSGLKRSLGVRDLIVLGVAAVIGAGIFSTVGSAAYEGGPGVVLLFIITAAVCGLTALCYAEFAGRVPLSGSAYTYSYVSFGEVAAWIIGWALIMEYAIGNVVVAISWSSYFNNVLLAFGIELPGWLITDAWTAHAAHDTAVAAGADPSTTAWATAPVLAGKRILMNLPACLITILVTGLVYVGIQESKRTANGMVLLKLLILAGVVLVGLFHINGANYVPFLPNGMEGVLKGVSSVFFAYIGFDAISTTAEECKDPQRDLPRGMLWSLVICTIVYCVVALVLTGIVPYHEFKNVTDPLAYVFARIDMPTFGFVVSVSAVIAATSVLLVFQLGQPRIWMSMSRDGLLPARFGHLHRKYRTPAFATIVTGVIVAVPALFAPVDLVLDLTSIGTLFAFALVCGGVLTLPRDTHDGRQRFRLPYINGRYIIPVLVATYFALDHERLYASLRSFNTEPGPLLLIFALVALVATYFTVRHKLSLIPVLGVLSTTYLMVEIPGMSWLLFFGWLALGVVVYLLYGRRHSKLAARA